MYTITVNLEGANTAVEVMKKIYDVFGVKYSENMNGIWDAFHDDMRDIEEYTKIKDVPESRRIHLIIEGYWYVKKHLNTLDFQALNTILILLTDPTGPGSRQDNINFTFEVRWIDPSIYSVN